LSSGLAVKRNDKRMDLYLNSKIAEPYKNNSQKARVMTEFWVKQNGYCPNCGNKLSQFDNNKPVADFLCDNCKEEYELKSKKGAEIGKKIVGRAYFKMIERIKSQNNPNLFLLTYDKTDLKVIDFLLIPKYYFTPDIVQKRKPLSNDARRAGWIGSYILIEKIPESGKIYFVKNSTVIDKRNVFDNWSKTLFLKNEKAEAKGWILDIMNCLDKIPDEIFSLNDVYKFEKLLKSKHPENNYIKEKIRQQLQILRDRGFIEFLGRGKYKKVK
jgi:type II restriction enzyme